jgi:neutral ceramidase
MTYMMALFVPLLVACGALWNPAFAGPLRAGVAVVEIPPPIGQALPGYGIKRQAERVHDPLFARVLLLRTEQTSLALITSDLYRLQSKALVDRIRQELNIEHSILSSSHNHSGPALDHNNRGNAWAKEVEEKIFKGVAEANENLFSANISWGRGALIGAHNVRIFVDDDSVRERWSNPEEEGTAPIDSRVTVIRVDDEEQRETKAVLVHYSCDAASLGPDSRDVSADFPGALARYVKTEMGENVVSLFAAGAAANIYPFRARLSGSEAYAEIEKMGLRLGREVVRVARGLRPTSLENELQVHEAVRRFRNRWEGGEELEVGVSTVLINRTLALVAVPATMFVEFQLALSGKSPTPVTLLLGSSYSSGASWAGYIPTIAAAVEGGFGASYGTNIEVGAGETVVDHGVIHLYRFLGKLDDLPRGRLVAEIPDLPSP